MDGVQNFDGPTIEAEDIFSNHILNNQLMPLLEGQGL
jgi:hypothetical protein